jgi:hypothetical protein
MQFFLNSQGLNVSISEVATELKNIDAGSRSTSTQVIIIVVVVVGCVLLLCTGGLVILYRHIKSRVSAHTSYRK